MKKLKIKTIISTFLFSILIISSCSKAKDDFEKPIATLSINENSFISGERVLFSVEVSDNDGLHDIDLDIYRKNHMETIVKNFNVHSHGKTIFREFEWMPEVELHTDFTAILTASDHSGNIGRDTLIFSVFPALAE
jgi:hypothetical protein